MWFLSILEGFALIILTSVIYYNSLGCGFVFDDVSAVRDNQDLRPSTSLLEIFKNDFWGTPMTEVTGVVGRAELLSSVMFLSAVLLYMGALDKCHSPSKTSHSHSKFLCIFTGFWVDIVNILIVGFLICVGTFSKEQCITVFGVFVAYELFKVYQSLSTTALSESVDFEIDNIDFICRFDNPAAHAPPLIRRLTHLYLIPVNLGLLILPSNLCADWTLGSLKLIDGWTDARNILTLIAFGFISLLALISLSWKTPSSQSKTIFMALSLMVFPFIPASNLFFPVGFVVAERVLYTPSLGFCLLIGLGYDNLTGSTSFQTKNMAQPRPLETKKMHRTNEYSLFTSALKVNPNNAKMWNNVGHSLEAEGKFSEALGYFRKAVDVQPNDMGARINVGRTYVNLGMLDKAEEAYYGALEYFPKPRKGNFYFGNINEK
ncbi:unnamed protein product [Trichobilharzia regenti]|nr:unnamed protein product [Trichobilharzia regenti]